MEMKYSSLCDIRLILQLSCYQHISARCTSRHLCVKNKQTKEKKDMDHKKEKKKEMDHRKEKKEIDHRKERRDRSQGGKSKR